MSEFMLPLILASAGVLITFMLCTASLKAWRGWLDLKRLELRAGPPTGAEEESPAALIEIASVKERLRRLEAIANGVEL